jgi:hypothetical protein
MALTLLQTVNKVLRKVGSVQGDAGEIASFTDSSRQQDVDAAIDAINDTMDELFMLDDRGAFPQRGQVASATFVLAADDFDYGLEADFVQLEGNPIDVTNNNILYPYPGGFYALREDYPDRSDFTGRPHHWVINPETGELEIDTTPTASEVGETYSYFYRKSTHLSLTTDTFGIPDDVIETLYDAFAHKWRAEQTPSDFSEALFVRSLARGAALLRSGPAIRHYGSA